MWIKGLPFNISVFLWRLWRVKLATDDMCKRQGYIYMSRCWCCQNPQEESFDHQFLIGITTTRVWRTFIGATGITVPLIQVTNGGSLSVHRVIHEINKTLHFLAKAGNLLPRMPFLWPDIIMYMEGYGPIIMTKRVAWKLSYNGWYKCNTDGASRDNPGPSSTGFCVRDSAGDFVYARAHQLEETTNIVAKARAINDVIHYCVEHDLHPLILETDSLRMKKIKEGEWDPPWCIVADVEKIKEMKEDLNVIF
ncbi:uncharacterized protein [Nicotiana tomentosiformis]|uniref:uncharacterized protein n=1 Tax=Nicotiana tomentosiformis TaxID=4098 RepID=UPI00388CBD0F